MITSAGRAERRGSIKPGRCRLAARRGPLVASVARRRSVVAAHDSKASHGGALRTDRRKREALAHERLDAHAAGPGEVVEQPALVDREADGDISDIRILDIAERMQSALRGQAHGGRTHGPSDTRLPCF